MCLSNRSRDMSSLWSKGFRVLGWMRRKAVYLGLSPLFALLAPHPPTGSLMVLVSWVSLVFDSSLLAFGSIGVFCVVYGNLMAGFFMNTYLKHHIVSLLIISVSFVFCYLENYLLNGFILVKPTELPENPSFRKKAWHTVLATYRQFANLLGLGLVSICLFSLYFFFLASGSMLWLFVGMVLLLHLANVDSIAAAKQAPPHTEHGTLAVFLMLLAFLSATTSLTRGLSLDLCAGSEEKWYYTICRVYYSLLSIF
ncbi:hypothetical protein NEDG_01225 [Nematocida displodere]|uniref:Uncharacterized protein n=1 Tax=Nematocida displodere TaxID=1805483 RepID=A0A177EBH9_9MICR|nr:hypothetical protein NEDG_01225 [Nematocida displodere]